MDFLYGFSDEYLFSGIGFYFLQKFYVSTARQVKRLESISRSPIYSHFGETVSGATTIRAYAKSQSFIATNEKKIDENQVCYYPTFVSSRWLAVRLETIGNILILFAALFAVTARDVMDPGLVGLSLSYALTVTQSLSYLVTMVSEVETNMVGVERIKEYQEITEEAPLEMPGQDPPKEWPEYGVVKFQDYQTRYRPGLDLVLKGVHFSGFSLKLLCISFNFGNALMLLPNSSTILPPYCISHTQQSTF